MPPAEDDSAARREMGARLRAERQRAGFSQAEFCARMAVSKTTQVNYESGKRSPDGVYLAAASRIGLDVLHVLVGDRPAAHATASDAGVLVAEEAATVWRLKPQPATPDTLQTRGAIRPATGPADTAGALLPIQGARAVRPLVLSLPQGDGSGGQVRFQVIPKHARSAAAGQGGTSADVSDVLDPVGDMAFSFDWLRRNLHHTRGVLTTVQVSGDSMMPTLQDGESIIIDEGVNTIDVDGIYVLDINGRRLVKRVQHLVDGSLVLISDNPAYQRETIPRTMVRDVVVVGRMVFPRAR